MKMVKSLLLGSAAGLAVVSTGQAADLPVKAKPVEYVKVCSLYGAGFYYMPGTDICLKIGGYVRAEITDYSGGNFQQGPNQTDFNNRLTNNLTMRARAYITADAREQTAFGTARAYVAVGLSSTDVGNTLLPSFQGFNRAFIQWAGITAGITQSFYDFYSSPAVSFRGYTYASDTGDPGWWVWGYTAQLGNGLTATLAAEQRRSTQICDIVGTGGPIPISFNGGATACQFNADILPAAGSGSATASTAPLGYGGNIAPDVVANIRIDQTWGSAQIMGAAHNVNAPYYSTVPGSGGPSDDWGFAVGAGLRLNFPMIAQGDYFQSQVNYTQGAPRYVAFTNNAPVLTNGSGSTMAFGMMSDCIYGAQHTGATGSGVVADGTGCNLTTAWGVNASYEHYWVPQFHESFVFGYAKFEYNDQANALLCNAEGFPGSTADSGSLVHAVAGCNNNWSVWTGATRFQWDVTKSLYLGVELMYQRYDTMTSPNGAVGSLLATTFAANGFATTLSQLKDQNNYAITARIHKDFLP